MIFFLLVVFLFSAFSSLASAGHARLFALSSNTQYFQKEHILSSLPRTQHSCSGARDFLLSSLFFSFPLSLVLCIAVFPLGTQCDPLAREALKPFVNHFF